MAAKRLIGIIALLVLAAWSWGARGERRSPLEAKADQQWSLRREGASGLELRTRGGNIQVAGADSDQLEIHAIKQARADREEDARAFLEQMKIERRREGDRWVVVATWPEPRASHVQSASVSFEVRVPRGMRLETQSGGGNVDVAGVGETRLRTGGGNIRARNIGGRLEVHTGGGNLQLEECAGPTELETGGGNIEIRQAQRAVKAHTGGGNIQVEGRAGPMEVHTGGGNIEICQAESPVKATTGAGNIAVEVARAGGAAQVELGTGAGEIDLRLPERISARVEADTGLGRVQLEPAAEARYNRAHSHVEAVLGGGQGSVRLHTGVGGIRVRLAGGRGD